MYDCLTDGILQVRRGLVQVRPGYDGVYGQVKISRNDRPSIKSSPQHQEWLYAGSRWLAATGRPDRRVEGQADPDLCRKHLLFPLFFCIIKMA